MMPNGRNAWALAGMVGLATMASIAPAKDKPDSDAGYSYGPPPDWASYKELAEAAVRARLIDPDSAKFEWPYGVKRGGYKGLLARTVLGYATCGFVNSKNRLGGYVGREMFAVVEDHGAVLTVDMSGMVDAICAKASLPPADAMGAGVPGDSYAFTLTHVPDGAYVATVAAGSAAERAGLKPGMVVSQLNGLAVGSLPLATVDQMLAAASGTVTLTMVGGNAIRVTKEPGVAATARAEPPGWPEDDDPEATRLPAKPDGGSRP
jgi:hypothetical protein